MRITPEIASEWLHDKWGEQRSVRNGHVDRLAADMIAGRFRLSSDAILRVNGKLANGQHRLAAVAQSGKPQEFIVMESNDTELYKVIDAGMKRTVSDSLIGIGYSNSIPSIARWLKAYESRIIRAGARCGAESGSADSSALTQSEIIDYCIENRELLTESAAFVSDLYEETKLLPISIGGAVYAIAKSRDGYLDRAKRFLSEVYVDGGNSAAGDLRNRLISNRGTRAKFKSGYVFGLTMKAFKSYAAGVRPGCLKYDTSEPFSELPPITT